MPSTADGRGVAVTMHEEPVALSTGIESSAVRHAAGGGVVPKQVARGAAGAGSVLEHWGTLLTKRARSCRHAHLPRPRGGSNCGEFKHKKVGWVLGDKRDANNECHWHADAPPASGRTTMSLREGVYDAL
jgi:hypothetical protein